MRIIPLLFGVVCACLGAATWASDVALILRNERYAHIRDAQTRLDVSALATALAQAGYRVASLEDLPTSRLQDQIADLGPDIDAAGRVILFLSGHVVTDGRDTWLLGTETRQETFDLARNGLPLSSLTRLLAPKQGSALMLVATSESLSVGGGLEMGYSPSDVPQGVTVLAGRSDVLEDILVENILGRGLPVGRALEGYPRSSVAGFGFLSQSVPFQPPTGAGRTGGGRYAPVDPETLAQRGETALGLGRKDRLAVQRALAILGYDPGAIDGVFGLDTRQALAAWQWDQRYDDTGYLTAPQIPRLMELARRRQEEADRSGRSDAEEREIWERARRRDSIEDYEAYLGRYPNGTFETDATIRLRQLRSQGGNSGQRGNADRVEQARAQEAQILPDPSSRVQVERRLAQLGLNPGEADGTFDRFTRKAIRSFQQARNLPVTGFMNQTTLALLRY